MLPNYVIYNYITNIKKKKDDLKLKNKINDSSRAKKNGMKNHRVPKMIVESR